LYTVLSNIVCKMLSKLVDESWRYSKPNQCHFWAWLKRPIFGVHDSQGSAKTLVRRGVITNYHLIAYSFSNISTKNCQNRLMCIEVIVCNVSVVFLRHSVNTRSPVLQLSSRTVCASFLLCMGKGRSLWDWVAWRFDAPQGLLKGLYMMSANRLTYVIYPQRRTTRSQKTTVQHA